MACDDDGHALLFNKHEQAVEEAVARNMRVTTVPRKIIEKALETAGLTFVIVDGGKTSRTIPMDDTLKALIEPQLEAFKKKFGREPGPNDPIFFDPDADTPQMIPKEKQEKIWTEGLIHLESSGVLSSAEAHAASKVGYILSHPNAKRLAGPLQKKEWNKAVRESRKMDEELNRIADEGGGAHG